MIDESTALLELLREEVASQNRFPSLERYYELRNKGLRSKAFESMEEFLQMTKSWDFEERKHFVIWFLELVERRWWDPLVDSKYFPHQLSERLTLPTLKEWSALENSDSRVFRWLGRWHCEGLQMLAKALELAPDDLLSRFCYARAIDGSIENKLIHLDENIYDGDPVLDSAFAANAKLLLSDYTEAPIVDLRNSLALKISMLSDFVEFSKAPSGSFKTWCTIKGRQYKWYQHYYY